MKNVLSIILAAGKSNRMKTSTPKVLCEILFKPMIKWVVDSCKNFGCKDSNICIIYSDEGKSIVSETNNKLVYRLQAQRLGTGHAVMQAKDFIENSDQEDVLIMLGDVPLISSDVLSELYSTHVDQDNTATILSSDVQDPYGYGRIIRDEYNPDFVLSITEELDFNVCQKAIKEINSGVMCFKREDLLKALDKIDNNNVKKEYYITSVIDILVSMNKKIGAYNCKDEALVSGVNTRAQLMQINNIARLNVIEKLAINQGVEFLSDQGVIISPEVEIGSGSTIYPGVIIKGKTTIGSSCIITSNSFIEDSIIDDNTIVKSSYISNSNIGKNVKIGPFSNIRPNCFIKNDVKIGDFVEVKNSLIGEKTSVAHLTYIGDSDVGKNVNFGCGCVTVNYDGINKYRTIIEDDCFIGCNTNLVAPVRIGKGGYTAAGTTVTDDVPSDSMCIARSRQVVKHGWKLSKK